MTTGRRLLMLDSGAFTVWNKGGSIDLDDYIRFCQDCPAVSYYVALDVIPGTARRLATQTEIDDACRQGWKNYLRMIRRLPMEKVIPVFHQCDSLKWLELMLEFECPYVGISPSNSCTTAQRRRWMATLVPYLFSGGKPVVKTHGFAVTSFTLMRFWQWHSVDGSSWGQRASYGRVFVPVTVNGAFDFTREPFQIGTSPKSPEKGDYQNHIDTLSPAVLASAQRWFAWCGVPEGSYSIVSVDSDYVLKKDELRWKGDRSRVIRIRERGVRTDGAIRRVVNAKFLMEAEKYLPVENIYFAGTIHGTHKTGIASERILRKRLLSYWHVVSNPCTQRVFAKHLEAVGRSDSRGKESIQCH